MTTIAFDITAFPGRRAAIPGRTYEGRSFFIIDSAPQGMYGTLRLQDLASGETIEYEAEELQPIG